LVLLLFGLDSIATALVGHRWIRFILPEICVECVVGLVRFYGVFA